jgi:hypothetical protein
MVDPVLLVLAVVLLTRVVEEVEPVTLLLLPLVVVDRA